MEDGGGVDGLYNGFLLSNCDFVIDGVLEPILSERVGAPRLNPNHPVGFGDLGFCCGGERLNILGDCRLAEDVATDELSGDVATDELSGDVATDELSRGY